LQGVDFGMWLTRALMPAFTHDVVIFNQHTTDTRVGISGKQTVFGQL